MRIVTLSYAPEVLTRNHLHIVAVDEPDGAGFNYEYAVETELGEQVGFVRFRHGDVHGVTPSVLQIIIEDHLTRGALQPQY